MRNLLSAILCLLITVAAARANLLVNGDFELASTPGTPLGSYSNLTGGTTIPGWTAAVGTGGSGPGVYLASNGSGATWVPNAQSGSYCVQLDSTNTGTFTTGASVSQTVALAANTTYWLTFRINTEVGGGKGGTSGIDVTITNPSSVAIVNAKQFLVTSGAAGSTPLATTPWATWQIQFKSGTAGNYTFKFQDDPISTNSNIALDNVTLETVPEVSHCLVFLGFGLGCAGWEIRRRRASAA